METVFIVLPLIFIIAFLIYMLTMVNKEYIVPTETAWWPWVATIWPWHGYSSSPSLGKSVTNIRPIHSHPWRPRQHHGGQHHGQHHLQKQQHGRHYGQQRTMPRPQPPVRSLGTGPGPAAQSRNVLISGRH